MILRQNPNVSLKLRYNLILRIGMVASLVFMIAVMVAFPKFEKGGGNLQEQVSMIIETTDIPIIEQNFEQPSRPSRPSIPIESDDENFDEDISFDEFMDFDSYQAWDAAPPPPEQDDGSGGPRIRFIPYDEPPEPIGGFAAIQRNVVYPEIAQEAGIEGTVVVQAFVNEFGVVTECVVLKGVPNTGLDEAAIAAIKKTRFKPAKQRDRNVGVYISIPVIFRLRNN
jgi:protein TonB